MRTFQRFFSRYLRARHAGDLDAALEIARAAHGACPEMRVKTWFWQACLLSLRGDFTGAISALDAGLGEGQWWSPRQLDRDPDLDGVREGPLFGAIRGKCVELFGQRQARARPQCLVLAPSSATWEPRSLFVIHGAGDTAPQLGAYWGDLVNDGWTLIIPQSSQVFDSMSFCWDDMDLARQELRKQLEDSRRKRGIAMDGMVMAGAAEGARLALELAHEMGVPWLCAIPVFPAGYDVAPLIGVPTHTRGAVLLGERDPATVNSRRVIRALESGGVSVVVHTMKDVSHDLPEDLPVRVADILRELPPV